MNLEKLFNPQSVAVVGASPEEGKIGNVIMKNLFKLGYKGKVFLVNPKYDDIFSQKCYKNMADIKEKVDLAVIAIPAKLVNAEIEKNAEKIKNFVVISAGFAEIGKEGKQKEEELLEIAEKNNLNILGPNCLGFIIPQLNLNASFAGGSAKAGNISFISQSGALAVAILDIAEKENLGFSHIISIGNKMQISESEILEFLAEDKNTKVIGMYLESVKNGQEFLKIAQKVSHEKPLIILKAGKNEKTQQAIASHTGALAGSDEIISAVFKKAGILRAENLEEFFNIIRLISNASNFPSEKAVIVTNAGGAGVLAADAFSGKKIQLADLDEKTKKNLCEFLPEESSVENPIDLLGDAQEDRYEKTLEIISRNDEIGSVICVLTPQDQTPTEKIAEEIIKFKNKSKKIAATVFLGGARVEKAIEKLNQNGIANFSFPEQAAAALDGFYHWSVLKNARIKSVEQVINQKRKEKAEKIIEKAKNENRGALYFSEAKELMDSYGIKTVFVEEILPTEKNNPKDFKFPAVLKVDSDKVLHKTDKKGLKLDIENREQLEKAIDDMQFNFPGKKLIVQPMAEKGLEIIIGIKRDAVFGPVILYGLGGIYAEFLRLTNCLVPPLGIREIEESLLCGKLGFLFQNARGQANYNLEETAKILMGVSLMAAEISEIREFDINPLIIYNNKKEASAVDVKVIL